MLLGEKMIDGISLFSYLLRNMYIKKTDSEKELKYLCLGMDMKKHSSKPSNITFASLLHRPS